MTIVCSRCDGNHMRSECPQDEWKTHTGAPAQAAVLSQVEAEARRYAGMYPQSSDGRNTFVIFADWVARLASQPSPAATVERREDETGEEYELRVGRVGRPQCSAVSREAIKIAIYPFCFNDKNSDAIADAVLAIMPVEPQTSPVTPADALVSQIEERFPNWKSFRDLVDCIDCTLHGLRGSKA